MELAQLQADLEVLRAQKVWETKKSASTQVRLDNQIAAKQAQIDALNTPPE